MDRGAHMCVGGDAQQRSEAHPTMDGEPGSSAPRGGRPAGDDAPPLLGSIRQLRDSLLRLKDAHLALLRLELAESGREIGIVVGLAFAAIFLALLTLALLYTGFWLFVGEWLFGSMAWGLIHGMLFAVAMIVGVVLNLAGGWSGAWPRGLLVGLLAAVVLGLLFASNILHGAAVDAGESLDLSLDPYWAPAVVGAVVGAVVLGVIALLVAWRMRLAGRDVALSTIGGLVLGLFVGAILGFVEFDNKGAFAVSISIGYLTWSIVAVALAARRGFDPLYRYSPLIPRGTIVMAQETAEVLQADVERVRKAVMER